MEGRSPPLAGMVCALEEEGGSAQKGSSEAFFVEGGGGQGGVGESCGPSGITTRQVDPGLATHPS